MHVQIKETKEAKEKEEGKETKKEAEDTNSKKGGSHSKGPLKFVFEDEARYDDYTRCIGIEHDAKVIPNRNKLLRPSKYDVYI